MGDVFRTVAHGDILLDRIPLDEVLGADADLSARASADPLNRLLYSALGRFASIAKSSVEEVSHELSAFREADTGILHVAHREILVGFREDIDPSEHEKVLKDLGLVREGGEQDALLPNFVTAVCPPEVSENLIEFCNGLWSHDALEFIEPNFLSEYRREIDPRQWNLDDANLAAGYKPGRHISAEDAWSLATGSDVTVAVVDDGVDVDHPALRDAVVTADQDRDDQYGRDFVVPPDLPDHKDPRPKAWAYPYDSTALNDIHGTACAGIIAARPQEDSDICGVAPECKILPVKIFHASNLANNQYVANALAYAGRWADVISCSWTTGAQNTIERAVSHVAQRGGRRGERGTPIVCATGNAGLERVLFPAAHEETIGVGAYDDTGGPAPYSNKGDGLWVLAPSGGMPGATQGILTTDVTAEGKGYSPSEAYWSNFGGTSAAAPHVAGTIALLIQKNPEISLEEIKRAIAASAGEVTGFEGAHGALDPEVGHGRLNAAAALALV